MRPLGKVPHYWWESGGYFQVRSRSALRGCPIELLYLYPPLYALTPYPLIPYRCPLIPYRRPTRYPELQEPKPMSRTESTMVQLGTIAPAFELTDVLTNRALSRDDVFALSWDDNLPDAANLATAGGPAKKHGLLVMFLSVHCPFVKHVEQEIANIARDYASTIAFCAIMSNDVAQYPDDSPDNMRAQAQRLGWRFPYLYDESQEVARSYNAACTPDFFLFNGAM